MNTSITRRLAAAVAAAALGVIGAVAVTVPASAAVPADIDFAKESTAQSAITVHKHAQPATPGAPGDGTDQGLTDGLDGVEFSLYRLGGIDLSTSAGWDAVEAVSEAIDGGATPVVAGDPPTSVTIGAAGTFAVTQVGATQQTVSGATSWASLDFGIYLVVEGDDLGQNDITNKAEPFVVSVPYATGDNTWLYHVHAYPKNSVTGISKTVQAPAPGSAEDLNRDLVRWQVQLDVPRLAAGEELTTFELVDTIDPAELRFVATPPAGVDGNSVTVTDAGGTALTVPAGSYEISPDPVTDATGSLTVTFTPAGRAWLAANAQGGTVAFSVLTRLVDASVENVLNSAVGHVNDATVDTEKTTPVGELEVFKFAYTDEGDTTPTGLAGARFALYTTQDDATAGQNRVVIDGVSEFGPSSDSGHLTIGPLAPGDYYLVETAAPAGYQLDATPRAVTIVAGETVRPGDPATGGTNYVPVENEQVPAWALPLTGGDGALWFGVGGAALVAVALGAALVMHRRRALAAIG